MYSKCLREAAESQGFYLVPCLYSPDDQQRAVNELIQEFRDRMADCQEWGPQGQGGCVALVMRLAMTLKDSSFAEEREWRLISRPKMVKDLEFRPGTSMLVPFFRFTLNEKREAYLESVRVGPTPHRELAARAVRMLLRKLELSDHPEDKVRETSLGSLLETGEYHVASDSHRSKMQA